MARQIKPFSGPDGTNWGVEVQVPGASNAMIVFHHPGGKTARLDRYAWDIWSGPESRSVTSRVTPGEGHAGAYRRVATAFFPTFHARVEQLHARRSRILVCSGSLRRSVGVGSSSRLRSLGRSP